VNSKLGDLVPPVVAGSLVTAAALLTLLPFLLGLVEVIRGTSPKSASNERRLTAAHARRDVTAAPADFHRSNPIPGLGNRKETTT
jgi:hypothetical protein